MGSSNDSKQGKRQRDPPRTGNHDNTTHEDSDDGLPGAKRSMNRIRERITHAYEKKTKETRDKRDETRTTPSVQFDVDTTNAGEVVRDTTVPLLAPTTLAEAPTLTLKDLVPEHDKDDLVQYDQDETFKAERIEFVVVERDVVPGEDDPAKRSDRDFDWEIPERKTFDAIMGKTIDEFTDEDWDLLDYMSFSSVGWNTGVGMFAFGSDKTEQMQKFRAILRNIEIDGKRFESYPKRMLLNRYAITIYFNAAFEHIKVPKLLFWFKKFNGFQGKITMVETRHYPADHPSRKGCKIASCDADQQFLDELYRYPKDHAFHIRFGGNLYVRGGERIDPDDPDAVRQKRPRLSRQAARKFIEGSGEDILNKGQREDDEAAKNFGNQQAKRNVGALVRFNPNTPSNATLYTKALCLDWGMKLYLLGLEVGIKTHLFRYSNQTSKLRNCYFIVEIFTSVFTNDLYLLELKRKSNAFTAKESRKYRWGSRSKLHVIKRERVVMEIDEYADMNILLVNHFNQIRSINRPYIRVGIYNNYLVIHVESIGKVKLAISIRKMRRDSEAYREIRRKGKLSIAKYVVNQNG